MSSGSPATNPSDLILVGPASCWQTDLQSLPKGVPIGVINEAGLFLKKFDYWFTCHPERMPDWQKAKGRKTWKWVCPSEAGDLRAQLPAITGSGSLFAALAGLSMVPGRILLAGCPMSDEAYIGYRMGWIYYSPVLIGRVFSASGWTRGYLESLGNRWPY